MMTTKEVGTRLVELLKARKNRQAIEELYADNVVAVEPIEMEPGKGRETVGKDAVLASSDWFFNMFEVHDATCEGPYPFDDHFICFMSIDLTAKQGPMAGQRMQMKEAGRYEVQNGKITRTEFYYAHDC
ncbi:MAG: nuclear transport factor 2 family protein [Phycisphaerales bacterium]|nr:nuclear transport factor 2 family protein [Phycisphaerales bacterium]